MRESILEQKFKKAVEAEGGLCLKFVSPGKRGVPDRICLFPGGKIVFAEIKAPDGRLHPLQKRCIQEFSQLGHDVAVIWSVEDIDKFTEWVKRGV